MEKLVDLLMTKLFQLAEYVCSRCSRTNTFERKQARPVVKMMEGELFAGKIFLLFLIEIIK